MEFAKKCITGRAVIDQDLAYIKHQIDDMMKFKHLKIKVIARAGGVPFDVARKFRSVAERYEVCDEGN